MKINNSENIKGGIFITFGMLLLAIGDNYIRYTTETIGLWQFHLTRSLIAIPILIIALNKKVKGILPQNFKPVFMRTLFMVSAMLIYFGSLAFLPISYVAAGLFTSPLFVIIFSIFFLKEQIYISRVFAVFIGSFGVVLVLNLKFHDFSILNLFPVLAGALYAWASIITRQRCRDEDPRSLMFMFFCGIGLVSFAILLLIEINQIFALHPISSNFLTIPLTALNLQVSAIIFMHAVVSVIGGVLITLGYQKGRTSFVAVFEYSFLFFVTFWGYIFFSDYLSVFMLLGMLLIASSGLVISITQTQSKMLKR